jgi:hypothetical protein
VIDQARLAFIETNTDESNPAQAYAKEWAQQVSELHERANTLWLCARAFHGVNDFEWRDKAIADHNEVMAEIDALNRKLGDFKSRLHGAPERMQ